jgi:ATP-dependent protease HslVU (ClpYQ) ATPase subunit
MAKLNNSPFIKVEATKFTQIGYQGGNVDSIIKDMYLFYIKFSKEKFRASHTNVRRCKKIENNKNRE